MQKSKILKVILVMAVLLNTFLVGNYLGIAQADDIGLISSAGWFVSGGSIYYQFVSYHVFLLFALFLVLIASSVKNEIVANALCVVGLLTSLVLSVFVYSLKLKTLQSLEPYEQFTSLLSPLKQMHNLDLISAFVFLVVLGYQIAYIFRLVGHGKRDE